MFYVFEGIDGIGKSTQARLLGEHFERQHLRVLRVREPGGTPLGERLREILLEPGGADLSPEVEAFLFMAARAHLCQTRIRPALEQGQVVVADRFVWSTLVYQGIAGGLDPGELERLGRLATRGLEPTLTFLIDGDPQVAGGRMVGRDRLERRGLRFQEEVRQGFLALARRFPERVATIPAAGAPEEVHGRVLAALRGGGLE